MLFAREATICVVDDDATLLEASVEALELADLPAKGFSTPKSLLEQVDADFAGVIVTDIRMPSFTGMEVLDRVRAIDAQIPVILMTGHGDMPLAIEALRHGAADFLTKPFATEHLIAAVRAALQRRHLTLDSRMLSVVGEQEAARPSALIGLDPEMVRLRGLIDRIALAPVDVLVEGETGTGKELVALELHRRSPRRGRPFVAINCGAVADAFLDLELFGQGSDEGRQAISRRVGRIEAANRGTLFLDEVDTMSPAMQVRLLRVIEDREVHPIGSPRAHSLDLRIIAATKVDLSGAVSEGRFRADLYHRLNMVRLCLPPLRARRGDIPLLFANCIDQAREKLRCPPLVLTDAIRLKLTEHDWPGNVRELYNFAVQALLELGEDRRLGRAVRLALPERLDQMEAALIREALLHARGNIPATVEMLGIPRKTLYDKIARHGIDLTEFRPRS